MDSVYYSGNDHYQAKHGNNHKIDIELLSYEGDPRGEIDKWHLQKLARTAVPYFPIIILFASKGANRSLLYLT